MSYARIGQTENAVQSYQAALAWLDRVEDGAEEQGWAERVETDFLLKEAQNLNLDQGTADDAHLIASP
jgi:phage gp36-like protein